MKLLIVTQVIDNEHPILGFFHRWVEEFAKHCEHVHVICLQAGKHSLPANVTVHSLGKEKGAGKLAYVLNFYKLIWKLRHEYDNVFVHMNQIYVILGAPFWRALRKSVGLWYAHGAITPSLKFATHLANKIFTASTESFRIKSEKVVITGHGIDTELFTPTLAPKDIDLITIGRITKVKDIKFLVKVLSELNKNRLVKLLVIGTTLTEADKKYETDLREYIKEHNLESNIDFIGKVSQTELPSYLNRAKIFVTSAQNGSLDKAMLEAMSCGLPLVSSAPGSLSLPLSRSQVKDIESFVVECDIVLQSNMYQREDYVEFVKKNNNLNNLVIKILYFLSK